MNEQLTVRMLGAAVCILDSLVMFGGAAWLHVMYKRDKYKKDILSIIGMTVGGAMILTLGILFIAG